MKTFEERYTAWIDNKLEGPALTSFELELSRRASAGEARADKEDATRLRRLLVTNLKAPALSNAEFFSHQLRERIDVEQNSGRRREEVRQARGSIFTWHFARLAGLGAACLFVGTALYYGTMPPHAATPTPQVAANNPPTAQPSVVPPAVPAMPDSLAGNQPARNDFAQASPMPPSVDLNDNIQIKVPPSPNNTTVTPLQYKDPNVNVLWINGLDYMPTVPGESPTSPAPAPAASAKP